MSLCLLSTESSGLIAVCQTLSLLFTACFLLAIINQPATISHQKGDYIIVFQKTCYGVLCKIVSNDETIDTSCPPFVVTFVSSSTNLGAVLPTAKQMGAVCYLNSADGRWLCGRQPETANESQAAPLCP